MKKILFIILFFTFLLPSVASTENLSSHRLNFFNNNERQIKSLLNSQVRYANRTNFNKFISTYDKNYINSDGFNIDMYSKLVKDIWTTYDKIKYGIKIKNISINDGNAEVELEETSYANIPVSKEMSGTLISNASSIYYLKKIDGKWKVTSDKVLKENTSMLYGEAQTLDIKLIAPEFIEPDTEYCALLEFTPPDGMVAIASIAMDKIEYPQQATKEVFRRMSEDNTLERLFVSNNENKNEYIVASIGLTKADICDLSIKLSLTGFGYKITRVNVVPKIEENNVKTE